MKKFFIRTRKQIPLESVLKTSAWKNADYIIKQCKELIYFL